MPDSISNGSGITRRDFLAAVSLLPFASPWIPRAAFAQKARTGPPADTAVARLAVYPPLGISRIGNSEEWFLAPEVPGLPPLSDGRYKDGPQRVKKQVQRFRVYAFNKAGEVVREITSQQAHIEWTVTSRTPKPPGMASTIRSIMEPLRPAAGPASQSIGGQQR